MGLLKIAGQEDRLKYAKLLSCIRDETPTHWPHGLTVEHFSPGNLWFIQKDASAAPVGFVGWQPRLEGPYKVGYYSVGVLPEYRKRGIASSAVSRLIEKKSREVDFVRALVVEGNTASERLADSIGVERQVFKQAGALKAIANWALRHPNQAMAAGGGAGAAGMDLWLNRGTDIPTSSRIMDAGINALGGALTARYGSRLMARNLLPKALSNGFGTTPQLIRNLKGSLSSIPITTVINHHIRNSGRNSAAAQQTSGAVAKANEIASQALASGKEQTGKLLNSLGEVGSDAKSNGILAALLLAGGVGAAGWGINRAITNRKPQEMTMNMKEPGGRIRVTLPTTNPGDAETILDLPFDQEQVLTRPMHDRLAIDTRKRLRSESKQRKKPRGYLFNTQVD